MASYNSNTQNEPAKMEQIITEFFAKSLHTVLESRCPYVSSRHCSGEQNMSSPSSSSSSSASIRSRDKWFNLALRECPAALENIDFWRQSNYEPMVVDVVLVQRPLNWDLMTSSPKRGLVMNLSGKEQYPNYWNSDLDELGCEAKRQKVIERWFVHYESQKTSRDSASGKKRLVCNSSHIVYKKLILLLRSLYLTVRLLPAYKLFRGLNSSGQIGTYNLIHRVTSFVEPFTRKEESDMQRFVFPPVDTSCGRLCISVLYTAISDAASISDASSETSTPMSPQFIPDYVGSLMTDTLKRLPSLPAPHLSPSSSPFGRRHSWSYDRNRASPPTIFPSPSPSPTYSESHASLSRLGSNRLPPVSVPRHLHEAPQVHTKQSSFEEYWLSPIFSPSPSPSPPPIYVPGSRMRKALIRSESAPVSIPTSKLANIPLLSDKQTVLPPPPLKDTRVVSRMIDRSLSMVQTGSAVEKLFSLDKGDTGKSPGMKISSNSSTQNSYTRSSGRLSFEDDFDDSEFSGPFVIDDDVITDPGNRLGSFDQTAQPCDTHEPGGHFRVGKSQDAAVGALVLMLKKAPPLRQDLSKSRNLLKSSKSGTYSIYMPESVQISEKSGFCKAVSSSIESSGNISPKTTADALEELRGFREMKDLLLKQGGRSQK